MKKKYVKPILVREHFTPTEYIAACGDSGTVYKFECNAGYRNYKGEYPYSVYDNSGNLLTVGGGFEPCGETHEAESSDTFFLGYMDDQRTSEVEHIDVYIWEEKETIWFPIVGNVTSSNYHCTTKLNMNEWETAKS